MKQYDSYKDSGVEWIGNVPSHWEVVRTRYLCKLCTGNKDTINRVDDGKYPFYVRSPKVERINTYSFDGEAILMAGDGVGAGKVFHYANGKFDYHQRVYNFHDFKRVTGKFFYYYIANNFRYIIEEGGAKNTVDSVRLYMIQNFLMTVPTKEEQRDIVSYLDKKCSEIDKVISAQQKRIALLQELKQSVITHAVTKGLDPNVEMKDSGVEWIGEVPTCWKVMPIKHIAKTNSGSTPKNIKGKTNDKSIIKWVRTTDLSDMSDYVYDSSEYLSEEEFNSASCPWLPKHTVVVAMYGGAGTIGKAGILGIDSTINQALCSLEPKRIEHYKYLYYTIKALRPYWMKLAASSRKDPNISQDIIRNMKVAVPSLSEQQAIAGYLDAKCSSIDSSISKAQHQVELLQEYKQSLITEVVTGKRKVS